MATPQADEAPLIKGYCKAEYAKSGRSTCKSCGSLISEGGARIGNVEQSRFHDGFEISWVHLACALKLGAIMRITQLKHWENLKFEDQEKVRAVTGEKLPADEAKVLKQESEALWTLVKLLKEKFKPKDLKAMMEANGMKTEKLHVDIVASTCADGLLNGLLGNCPDCEGSAMGYHSGRLVCHGWAKGGFTKCGYRGWKKDVKRFAWVVPEACKIPWLEKWMKQNASGTAVLEGASSGKESKDEAGDDDDDDDDDDLESMSVAALKSKLTELGGKAAARAKKADLISAIEELRKAKGGKDEKDDGGDDDDDEEEVDVDSMTVAELKDELTSRGETAKGVKKVLQEQLRAVLEKAKTEKKSNKRDKTEPASNPDAKRSKLAHKPLELKPKAADNTVVTQVVVKREPPEIGSAILKISDDYPDKKPGDTIVIADNGLDVYNTPLTEVNLQTGHNRFYLIQLIQSGKNYILFTRWGRTGAKDDSYKRASNFDREDFQIAKFKSKSAGIEAFNKKFHFQTENHFDERDRFVKKPGRYFLVELATKVEEKKDKSAALSSVFARNSKLDARVQQLMTLIFDQQAMTDMMLAHQVDLDKMPLGNLTRDTLLLGYGVLKEIEQILEDWKREEAAGTANKNKAEAKLVDASTRFYTIIPSTNPTAIRTIELLKIKISMMDALMDVTAATEIMKSVDLSSDENPLDKNYKSLKTSIEPLPKDGDEWQWIQKFINSHHDKKVWGWGLEIEDVFRIERDGEAARFSKFAGDKNRQILWHGSPVTNFIGILSNGMRIAPPEAPKSGYLFGKGAYFANMVSKSSHYCRTSKDKPTGIMLLSEVALGNMFEVAKPTYMEKPQPGTLSTKCMGATFPDPKGDMTLDNGTIVPLGPAASRPGNTMAYDELVVYDTSQIFFKYLIRLKFTHSK